MKIRFKALNGVHEWDWIRQHIPVLKVEDSTGIMAVDLETGQIIAACVLDNFTENSVQAHFVAADTMVFRHGFAQECFRVVFEVCDKKCLYAYVLSDNEPIIKMAEHVGFTELARMEQGWDDDVDYLILELKKENCTYLPKAEAA